VACRCCWKRSGCDASNGRSAIRNDNTHCRTDPGARQSAIVLAELGFRDVKLFDPSWLGHSSWLSAPAEDQVWAHFGALLTVVKGLEDRYGELQK
jgi:hypothetical protein